VTKSTLHRRVRTSSIQRELRLDLLLLLIARSELTCLLVPSPWSFFRHNSLGRGTGVDLEQA